MTDWKWLDAVKETYDVQAGRSGQGGIQPCLFLRRDDATLSVVFADDARFLVLNLAGIAVSGFEPDELILCSDVFGSTSETNPEGKPWSHGEMQRRADEPAVAALLNEAVMAVRMQRGAELQAAWSRYVLGESGIVWGETTTATGFTGVIADGLRRAFAVQTLRSAMKALGVRPEDFGLTAKEAVWHTRFAAMRFMAERASGHQVGFALCTPDEAIAEKARGSMARKGFAVEVVRL